MLAEGGCQRRDCLPDRGQFRVRVVETGERGHLLLLEVMHLLRERRVRRQIGPQPVLHLADLRLLLGDGGQGAVKVPLAAVARGGD